MPQGAGVMQQNQHGLSGPVVVMQPGPGQMMPVGHPGMMPRHIQPGQVSFKQLSLIKFKILQCRNFKLSSNF
jgi:hypothetical protein